MMENFIYQRTTELIFGKDQIVLVGEKASAFGRKILLVSYGGAFNENVYYKQVVSSLKAAGLTVYELGEIKPNPDISKVREGIGICREKGIDLVLGVGGGSVIDTCKTIALGYYLQEDPWEIFTSGKMPEQALPIGVVVTLAATGSEMNASAVITNAQTEQKLSFRSQLVVPKFSILDPRLTFTVPKEHTVYGIVDIAAHVYEQYFDQVPDTPIQDRMAESVLQTLIEESDKVIADPQDYGARANIMLASTLGFNGILGIGKATDWASHKIQHELGAIYDIPHGGGLAIIFPNWMKYVCEAGLGKFVQYATRVFKVDPTGKSEKEIALEGIERTRAWFNSMGAPSRLADYSIGEEHLELMAEKATKNGPLGNFKKLYKEDVLAILRMSL
jgi:alcohol dehydrogenase YqhD (iron-dependent ADH family)